MHAQGYPAVHPLLPQLPRGAGACSKLPCCAAGIHTGLDLSLHFQLLLIARTSSQKCVRISIDPSAFRTLAKANHFCPLHPSHPHIWTFSGLLWDPTWPNLEYPVDDCPLQEGAHSPLLSETSRCEDRGSVRGRWAQTWWALHFGDQPSDLHECL